MTQRYIIHHGTGTILTATECVTIRLTDEQADHYADGTMPDQARLLLPILATPIPDDERIHDITGFVTRLAQWSLTDEIGPDDSTDPASDLDELIRAARTLTA